MEAFPIMPVNRYAIAARRPVYGRGINDADYRVKPRINGKQLFCPIYDRWHTMLKRAYCKKYQAKKKTYSDCSVCDEWLYFSNFREWMLAQDWQGKALDKDILIPGNKIYSPDACVFVDADTNKLLNDNESRRGEMPIGVRKFGNRFSAQVCIGGRQTYIGQFGTQAEAVSAYSTAKASAIREAALRQPDARVRDALIARADSLLSPPATTSNRR